MADVRLTAALVLLATALAAGCGSGAEPSVPAPAAGTAVGIASDNAGSIWMTAPRRGTFRSLDGGHTWKRIGHTFGARFLTFVPRGTLLANGRQLRVAPTQWKDAVPMRRAPARVVGLATPYPRLLRVYALDGAGHVWVSVNQGWSWQPLLGRGLPAGGVAIAAVRGKPILPDTLYVAVAGQGIWRSTDFGLSFRRLPDAPSATALATTTDARLRVMAATADGIYRSDDGGATWRRLSTERVTALAIDFRNYRNAVALRADGRLLRSSDGGDTWGE